MCLAEADGDKTISKVQRDRLQALHEFTSTMDRWYGQMLKVQTPVLMRMIRMGDKIVSVLGVGRKAKDKARID